MKVLTMPAAIGGDAPEEADVGERPVVSGPVCLLNLEEDDIGECIRAGDARGAMALCARRFGNSIGRLCFSMLGAQADAEEATQETLLIAYDSIHSYRAEGAIRSWLFGIARRVCARRLEVAIRQARRRPMIHDDAEPVFSVDVAYENASEGQRVREALSDLRPSEREAVLLRYVSELSCREVGEACGIEEAAARKRIGRAVTKLRHHMMNCARAK